MTGERELANELARALGGTVTSIRRLSGGASRVTSAVDMEDASGRHRALVLQQARGTPLSQGAGVTLQAALLRRAERAGVPVPKVLAAGATDGLDAGWLVVERLDGETIARRILRDDAFSGARTNLTSDAARALARIHSIPAEDVADLPSVDPLARPLEVLDATGEVRPILELGIRWLAANEPESAGRTLVHGDFRLGNLLVDATGLRGVLDWELAHAGDPAEDLGWLTAPAWRFGGSEEVGGFGHLDDLLTHYEASGGGEIGPATVRWWQVYATVKWAVICALQAAAHLSGSIRSVELAAIGRRICESEWDLLGLVGVERSVEAVVEGELSMAVAPFGRPTARELVEAVQTYLEDRVMTSRDKSVSFEARIARNALGIVARELALGPGSTDAHRDALNEIGYSDDATLASAIRSGALDQQLLAVGAVLSRSAFNQLCMANPAYVPRP